MAKILSPTHTPHSQVPLASWDLPLHFRGPSFLTPSVPGAMSCPAPCSERLRAGPRTQHGARTQCQLSELAQEAGNQSGPEKKAARAIASSSGDPVPPCRPSSLYMEPWPLTGLPAAPPPPAAAKHAFQTERCAGCCCSLAQSPPPPGKDGRCAWV
uniref:Uncharacterized protein n=1 Tax=Pipistrellus kuhlii TaxID=59472 RepID=A0A7J8A8T4_PIPKU|nr:hypothetical protein mPipKuh1_009005 [Pipistrellus kuhlii]